MRRAKRLPHSLAILIAASFAGVAFGQTDPNAASGPVDLCGTLVSGGSCVLFQSGGSRWYIADYGEFRVGDEVRVVGTANPNCTSFCGNADGCIQGAELYNIAVYPCGAALPSLETDLLPALTSTACSVLGGALTGFALVGACRARRCRLSVNPPKAASQASS